MSGYVDHAWRHRPKALGGTDPIESGGSVDSPASIKLSKTGSTVNVTTPWADKNHMIAWTTSITDGPDVATRLEYDTDVGSGDPGIRILTGGIYIFQWYIQISPLSTATTNTTRLIPKFVQFVLQLAPASDASFASAGSPGVDYNWANCTRDGGVNEQSCRNSNSIFPPSLGGSQAFYIKDDDANLPYILSCRFLAYNGAHDYQYLSPNLHVVRIGDYLAS